MFSIIKCYHRTGLACQISLTLMNLNNAVSELEADFMQAE